jgi:hypothetical protein
VQLNVVTALCNEMLSLQCLRTIMLSLLYVIKCCHCFMLSLLANALWNPTYICTCIRRVKDATNFYIVLKQLSC